ncbi:putative reverse transcriptase domain-containing protein [Tanacetum coccineum]
MALKRATMSNIALETTNTTYVTNAQLQAMINQGVTAALAARDANTNGVDSHNSGTGARRNERATRECTYPDFMKCQPLNFKGTEGVVELTQWIEKMENVFLLRASELILTVGNDIAYAMTWTELKKKITDKTGNCLCGSMFPEESDKIEKYVGGLPDMIHGSVVASKPKTMQEAAEMAIEVMDKRIRTFSDRRTENKRNPYNNQQPQQHHQNKRHNTGRAYAAGTVEKKQYRGSKPLCSNSIIPTMSHGTGSVRSPTFLSVSPRHFKRELSQAKNKTTIVETKLKVAMLHQVYARAVGQTRLQRRDGSQIDIPPTALDHYYDVELADRRIIGLNTILRGCTLNILNHPFNIDLMPVELGSFDAIIGMDWLVKYQAIIVCAEKIVRIPWGNETLIVHGDESNRGHDVTSGNFQNFKGLF